MREILFKHTEIHEEKKAKNIFGTVKKKYSRVNPCKQQQRYMKLFVSQLREINSGKKQKKNAKIL